MIAWSIFWWTPEVYGKFDFWLNAAREIGGRLGQIAAIVTSPWFNLALMVMGIAYLCFVGESERPVRHPIWPILGWVVFGVVVFACWSILIAGYVATHIPQQVASEAKAQIHSLTQAKQQLQEKVTALEQQASPRVLTEAQLKKMVDALKKVPAGTSHRVIFEALSSCNECAGFMGDIMAAWKDRPE